jgi:hypothetical protein
MNLPLADGFLPEMIGASSTFLFDNWALEDLFHDCIAIENRNCELIDDQRSSESRALEELNI